MFKRFGLTILFALALSLPAFAGMDGDRSQPDIAGFGQSDASRVSSTPVVMIDYDGDILPAKNIAQDLGESTRSFKRAFVDKIQSPSGFINIHETWVSVSSANQQGLSATGFSITTITVGVSQTVLDPSITQSSSVPRNLVVFSSAANIAYATGLGTMTLSGSATFYGIDAQGQSVSEVIFFSTMNVTLLSTMVVTQASSIFNSTGVGNVAWSYISSFTVSLSSISNSMMGSVPGYILNVGWGNKLGLANPIEISTDVYKITLNGNHVSQIPYSVQVDTVKDTIVIPFASVSGGGGAPTGERVDLWYRVKKSPEK